MRYVREDRISIDIDNFNQFNMLKTYYNMKHCFGENVIIKETRHGYHIMAHKKDRTVEENLHYRLMFCDCTNRSELDHFRYIYDEPELTETLFLVKQVIKEKGEEKEFNHLAEPFWSVKNHAK